MVVKIRVTPKLAKIVKNKPITSPIFLEIKEESLKIKVFNLHEYTPKPTFRLYPTPKNNVILCPYIPDLTLKLD